MAGTGSAGHPGGGTTVLTLVLVVVLIASGIGLQAVRDARYTIRAPSDDLLYVRSGTWAARLALSYDALLADVYWIRALQHFGKTRLSKDPGKQYSLLYPLLDLTTSLDPHFTLAYRFGAIFLAEPLPDGPGRPDQAVALLERGLRADPDRWEYAMDAGFVHYWWEQDYQKASAWFERAGGIAGAPWWVRSMAASVRAQGGDRASSRQLWRQLYETANHEWLKNNAELRLVQIDALDQIDALAEVVARYTGMAGKAPESWNALVRVGLLPGVPLDPTGTPYLLDGHQPGGVTIARESRLYPLPSTLLKKASPPS
jgi:tetratricopeptide (TPR) repeat protein